jgi:opacity protein-like surface antigen
MGSRRIAALAVVSLLSGASAARAEDVVKPRAGVLLSGMVHFPRAQQMSVQTAAGNGSRLTVAMAFDGRCSGGGLAEVWAANVPAKPTVHVVDGRFSAKLTGTVKHLGGVDARVGHFHWSFSGRFVRPSVVAGTVTGRVDVKVAGKIISRCKIAKPASVRLAVRRG